jgi:hypothetical protein
MAAAETDPYASTARGNRIRAAATPEQNVEFESSDIETVECDCGIAARYVQGRSGSGWVCGHFGTGRIRAASASKTSITMPQKTPSATVPAAMTRAATLEEPRRDTVVAPRSGKASGKAKGEYALNGSAR